MPCPNWPCAHCSVAPNLFDVINAAIGLINVSPSQAQLKDAIVKAAACGKHINFFTTPGPSSSATTLQMHVDRTQDARNAALMGNWAACISELDHAGGGGKGSVLRAGAAARIAKKNIKPKKKIKKKARKK